MIKNLMDHIRQEVKQNLKKFDGKACRSYENSQLLFGQLLRGGWLPSMLSKEAFSDFLFEELKNTDPYLWNRFVYVLSFGYNTGKVLHSLLDDNEERIKHSCHMASLFNLIITIYDYLFDECNIEQSSEEVISRELLFQLLMGDRQLGLLTIQKINKQIKDPRLQMLLSSIYSWIIYTEFIYTKYKYRDKKLYEFILELFEAEKYTIEYSHNHSGDDKLILDVLHKKSAGPFVAIGKFILEITPEITDYRNKIFESVVNDIGDIFFIVDDLSDLEKDFNMQTPNSILLRGRNINSNELLLSNSFLIKAIDDTIKELLLQYQKIKINAAFLSNDKNSKVLDEYLIMNIASWLNLFQGIKHI